MVASCPRKASLKMFAALVMLLCSVAVIGVDAQFQRGRRAPRSFVNADSESALRRFFPTAAAFSPLEGDPPHITAYAGDPRSNSAPALIGFAFWTTDLVPNERGYHGPIRMLVGMDLTGILTGVVVDSDTEPYGYFSVEPRAFAAQFAGKSIRDGFRVGIDIDAVSRASLSIGSATRAIRDSSRLVARALLTPSAVK